MTKQKKVVFRIKRYDAKMGISYFQEYTVPKVHHGMTVLEGLFNIIKFVDGSLSYRYSCRGAICGSCSMKVNGDLTLACHTQVEELDDGPITIEPLPNLKPIKDLVVDMEPFFEKYRKVQPYMPTAKAHRGELLQSPQDRKKISHAVNCILCACCESSCPTSAMDPDYLGPAALTAAGRFAFDSRNPEGPQRLLKLNKLDDFLGCMKIQRCTKACPKGIDPAERVKEVRDYVEAHRKTKEKVVTSVCGYCSTGCGLKIYVKGKKLQLTTDPQYPVNVGSCCPKGWEALTVLNAKDRATVPLLRKNGTLRPVEWKTAIDTFVKKFKAIQKKHGQHSIAFISTGQMPTEEMALLGFLGKFGMGMIHADGNTRQCMATAVVAYKQSFGFDAPPYTYKDFEESDVIVFIGANPVINHPIMWERITRNKHNPQTIVIDPRRTKSAEFAKQHLAINPKADIILFYGIAKLLIDNNWIDREFIKKHTEGFNDFKKHVQKYTLEKVSKKTGLSKEEITHFAQTIHEGKRVSFWWTMGVNQSYIGVRTAQSIINLALMTGNIGKPGTGANSITGQCNAMGSRLYSNTTCLPAGRAFNNEKHREEIAKIMKLDVARIPEVGPWAYDQIVEGINQGKIKGLWFIATNGAHSWINQESFRKILKKLDFFVVQDMYHSTDSAQLADLVLPAAGWGEKEGTFINSERRFGRIHKVANPPGRALPDYHIFQLIAKQWGCDDLFAQWDTPEKMFHLLKKTSKGMPCDITGIKDYAMLDKKGGIQWPYPKSIKTKSNERRLFSDGKFYHPSGKAKFIFDDPVRAPELPSKEYPLVLITGRGSVAQFHTQTRTEKSTALRNLYPHDPYVEMHPVDAKKLHIKHNQWVRIQSRRGDVRARAHVDPKVQPGHVFMSMHYVETNKLTYSAFDPYSHQPSYKICAVKVIRARKVTS